MGKAIRSWLCWVIWGLVLAGSGTLSALPIPPAPSRYVTDQVGLLQQATQQQLNQQLYEHDEATGQQVIVWIAPSLEGEDLNDWTNRAFRQWGVGDRELNRGAALFIFTEDRAARIEVGYGLEGALTDLQSGRILQEVLFPDLRAGRPDQGVRQAIMAILAAIEGETGSFPADPDGGKLALLIFFGTLGLILLVTWLGSRRGPGGRGGSGSGPWIGGPPFGGPPFGGSGGSGGFGGGFSGGGGLSGGGGAGGRW
jgi:uncharacterized protein